MKKVYNLIIAVLIVALIVVVAMIVIRYGGNYLNEKEVSASLETIEEELNKEMVSAKNSIKTLDEVSIDKNDIVYELDDDNNVYEADYIKYDILESTNYLTIGVVKGHLNITSDVDNNTLKYYTFKKSDGHIMSMDEIKSAGKIKNSDILDTEKSYLEDKIDTEIKSYELYMDKYENVRMNMLVNSGDITYNDTVKIN